jgi:hypothetical protein
MKPGFTTYGRRAGLEPATSTVSRSHLAVTDGHSTALAATFGVVRNTRELLMDPDWTQIVAATNCQVLVRVEELATCFQALSEGFEHRRTLSYFRADKRWVFSCFDV